VLEHEKVYDKRLLNVVSILSKYVIAISIYFTYVGMHIIRICF